MLRCRSGPARTTPTQLHFAEVAAVFPLIAFAQEQSPVFLGVCSPAGRRRAHSALNGPRRPAWEPVRLFGLNALFGVCWDANTWIDAAGAACDPLAPLDAPPHTALSLRAGPPEAASRRPAIIESCGAVMTRRISSLYRWSVHPCPGKRTGKLDMRERVRCPKTLLNLKT